jgi:hypothetical protein
MLVLVMYVDDLIIRDMFEKVIPWFKIELVREFNMKDIGLMHYFGFFL